MTSRGSKHGRVLLVGGSEDFVGAPYLAGIAALRSGAESVVVMAPEKVAWAMNALSPDLMTRKLRGKYLSRAHERAIMRQTKTADILVLGMGAGLHSKTKELMRALIRLPLPKVIDADALKALRGNEIENAILTPNQGEWKSLERESDIRALLQKGNVIVKKGFPTEIWTRRVHISVKTNKGLRKAGTGDVLAGMCAGFWASGLSPLDAAEKACRVGNDIADILTKKKKGYYFLASDIAKELSSVSEKI
ncbi:NAD(P)H-hydrate dehydratase [Candidatus Kaiserbacteria bacterium]|nr:NAD(P)H-hydrate dehydratase [Candidatus Kaiserbacteria bacterium]